MKVKSLLIARMLVCGVLLSPVAVWGQQAQQFGGNSKWWAQTAEPAAVAAGPQAASSPAETLAVAEQATPVVPVAAPAMVLNGKDFDCVEVRRFEAGDGGFITSREQARAAGIPEETLASLQRAVAGQIPEKLRGFKATLVQDGAPECPDPARALVLSGRVVDFKEGSQALRYWVGFGAGAQKFTVQVRAIRKSDTALIGEGEVTDRKVGGWVGGQAEKGVQDFAEKVAGFLKGALQTR